MATPTIEERLTAVEAQVEELKQRAKADKSADKSDENIPWWERIVGIHADSPDFEEVVRLGKEWRESEDSFGDGSGPSEQTQKERKICQQQWKND